ncbi:MAG: tetratricopeptide repeat protein [Anaerolineae bacterium]|nr:tetratricopeptide repeat protein [Anaerolineae bacterium]
MSGNRQVYEQAMNMGHSAAWDQEWDKAISAYGRAVQEMPEDPAAHNSLGLALLQARRLEDALRVYTRAHQLAPDDAIPLEKSADVLERLGRLKEAAQQYVNVAEVYLAQRDLEKAIGNWERATRLTSGLVNIHQRLALAYERTGHKKSAIREYLTLAFHFQANNRANVAIQAVERALRIEPQNPQALNTLRALKTGVKITVDTIKVDEPNKTNGETPSKERNSSFDPTIALRPDFADALDLASDRAVGEADPRGPIGEALETALAALASFVFESGDLDEGGANTIQAIGYQRDESIEKAIDSYERALDANMRHPGVHMNLGALYLQLHDWDNAQKHLQTAAADPTLASGALHGLSQVFDAQHEPRKAARHLIETLRAVDVSLAMNTDEATQLSAIYDRLQGSVAEADEHQLQNMNERFLELLVGPIWKQRVAKTRRQLEEAISLQEPDSLISLAAHIDDRVTEGLNRIDRFVKDRNYFLAMDEAHYMLESAPDYLPVHWRIGQILLERNNIPAAMAKYKLIADTYLIRGDDERAAEILHEAIKLAPMDTSLHQSLIKLLQEQENWNDLLNQYIDMADAYYQLGDLDQARSTYQQAIQLAEQQGAPEDQLIHIMHRLGEIHINRLDLRQALRTYEQIRKMNANDERARRNLVDLNYRLNDGVSAIRELDGLLRVYAKAGKANQILSILAEQVTRYPNDMALRSRLAAVYGQTGQQAQAIEQLDALAELQLESGRHNDALVTIRRIIAMNPPHVDDYKRLLQQLSG